MGPKRKRPPSGVLVLTTGRTDQIAHDLVLADLRLWVKTSPDDPETGTSEISQKADILGARWHVSKVRQPIDSRAIAVRLNRFTALHHMKFDPGGDRTRW